MGGNRRCSSNWSYVLFIAVVCLLPVWILQAMPAELRTSHHVLYPLHLMNELLLGPQYGVLCLLQLLIIRTKCLRICFQATDVLFQDEWIYRVLQKQVKQYYTNTAEVCYLAEGDKWRWQEKDMTGQLVEEEVGEWSQEVDMKGWPGKEDVNGWMEKKDVGSWSGEKDMND